MVKRPPRLWDQYEGKALAELLRGSGWWPAQSKPCQLEPPCNPFDRRVLTPWDCAVNDWEAPYGGGLVRQALSPTRIVHPTGESICLPALPYPLAEELTVISVEQFAEDETTLPMAEQFLRSLLALRRPVAFELVGVGAEQTLDYEGLRELIHSGCEATEALRHSRNGWSDPYTTFQFTAHRADAGLLERQLQLHYPNSSVVSGERSPGEFPVHLQSDTERSCGATLALDGWYAFPLRTYRQLSPDVLAVAVAAMETLGREDWAVLQVLFAPARQAWADSLFESIVNPYSQNDYFVERDELRLMKTKFQSPLFAVSVRLMASRVDVFQQLLGWSQQFSSPPHQRLVVNAADWIDGRPTDDERWWLDSSASDRCTHRPGMLLNAEELAGLVHLPGQHIVSERLKRTRSRTRPAPRPVAASGAVLLGENVHQGKRRTAIIRAEVRPWHCYIAGATGSGKSTLLLNMLLQDVRAGAGVGVIDPHGDLISDILPQIPEERIQDIVYFNPTDFDFPPALNILQATGRLEREHLVSDTVTTLRRFFPDSWGVRMEHILAHTLMTVTHLQGGTLREVRRILTDEAFRYRVVSQLTDPDLLSFWNAEFPALPKGSLDPILNKLSPFLMKRTVRNIVCQPKTLIDFDAILNRRKILLANLSFGLLGEAVAGTLGTFLMTKLLGATFRRAQLPKSQRTPFYLYIDEVQNFLNVDRSLDKILSEARKFGLVLAGMANQYVRQLTPDIWAAISGNVGSIITFRLGLDDARMMSNDLQVFSANEIMKLQLGEAFARVGSSEHVFNLKTAPPPSPPDSDRTHMIIELSRQHYARPRKAVEAMFQKSRKAKEKYPGRSKQKQKASKASPPAPEVTLDDLSDFVV